MLVSLGRYLRPLFSNLLRAKMKGLHSNFGADFSKKSFPEPQIASNKVPLDVKLSWIGSTQPRDAGSSMPPPFATDLSTVLAATSTK